MQVSYPLSASTYSSRVLTLIATWGTHFNFSRQIPYAIGQFTVNEFCHELAFSQLSEEAKRDMGPSGRFSIALGSGILAGFAAAILSHVISVFFLFLLIRSRLLTLYTACRYPS